MNLNDAPEYPSRIVTRFLQHVYTRALIPDGELDRCFYYLHWLKFTENPPDFFGLRVFVFGLVLLQLSPDGPEEPFQNYPDIKHHFRPLYHSPDPV